MVLLRNICFWHRYVGLLSPRGRTQEREALDRIPVARALKSSSTVWAAELRNTDSVGDSEHTNQHKSHKLIIQKVY